jgi:hypothetical protein
MFFQKKLKFFVAKLSRLVYPMGGYRDVADGAKNWSYYRRFCLTEQQPFVQKNIAKLVFKKIAIFAKNVLKQ